MKRALPVKLLLLHILHREVDRRVVREVSLHTSERAGCLHEWQDRRCR